MNLRAQIKKICLKNLIYPIVMLAAIISLFLILPFGETFHPKAIGSLWENEKNISANDYISTTIEELYYSGYNVSRFGRSDFGYYYTLHNNKCIFVLIPVSDTPKEIITDYPLYGKVIPAKDSRSLNQLLPALATDLGWSTEGIGSVTYNFVISNADYYPMMYLCFLILLLIGIGIAGYLIAVSLIHYVKPHSYPLCPHTDAESRKRLISKAEYEMENHLILHCDTLYLTEHYFVEINRNRIIILPLARVVWGYRMGTLNYKLRHKTPRYNLFLTLKSGETVVFINKESEHASRVLEEMRDLNYGIILGYTEAKKKKAKERMKR